ncbi:MAG: ribosomal protein S18-alanine N-acetyltransferase [Erysipelotrichaceae bacterium]|nr:ribosomal protein S18-alanine N-acetyltransferase [Erysipelotrichaceae bacterium]
MIRNMRFSDIDEVIKIEETVFNDNWNKEAFIYELKDNPFSYYWVIDVGDKIIGYAGLWITFDSSTITNIAILPEFQRCGWGQKLMDKIIFTAISKECETISLEVRVSNHKAIALYQKNGFIKINVKKAYYRNNDEDAYYMVKPLGRI